MHKNKNSALKFASFAVPMIGGVYSVARCLREGLTSHGVTVRWIGVGPRGVQAFNEPGMESERIFGELVAPEETNLAAQAKAVVDHLEAGEYGGVLVDVLGGVLQANIARYLPKELIRVLIVHSITVGTYSFAKAVRDYVHAAVGVSPRIRHDLIYRCSFPESTTICIPNGINIAAYSGCTREHDLERLRILFIGRMEDTSKGIFWLPSIMVHLNGYPISLTIAGDGPDLAQLKKRMKGSPLPVNFTGAVDPKDIPSLVSNHDLLLMPSRFEGFCLTLIEAMAAGCVPIASRISGVTDFIVQEGQTGFLFPIGDTQRAAKIIEKLLYDRDLLNNVANAAKQAVKNNFTAESMASAYARLLTNISMERPQIAAPISLNEWEVPSEFKGGIRSRLPQWVKNAGRWWYERFVRH
jgi:glycosyltransferase involved in cell wall biosynthesis